MSLIQVFQGVRPHLTVLQEVAQEKGQKIFTRMLPALEDFDHGERLDRLGMFFWSEGG